MIKKVLIVCTKTHTLKSTLQMKLELYLHLNIFHFIASNFSQSVSFHIRIGLYYSQSWQVQLWWNKFVQNVIWVEWVWDIWWYSLGKALVIKNLDAVAIKESKYSEIGCLITLGYFWNTYPISISNFVHYWAVNNILNWVNLIQSVSNS